MKDEKTRRYARGAPLTSLPADHAANLLGHELGNVLNGLLGMTGLLRDSGLDAEQERWLEAIEQAGRQMARLIESAALLAEDESADSPAAADRLDGLDLLEQIVCCHFPASARRCNRLLLVIDPALDRFWLADPRSLRQLLDNLLDNANKHTRDGDIVLEARSAAGDTLVLDVSDTGRGMDRGLGRRLFEPYRRGVSEDHRPDEGLGLGLYVCRRISAAMGGRIEAIDRSDRGACLRITLPGLLGTESAGTVPRPALLSGLHCRLELDDLLNRSVSGFLSRIGIDWAVADKPADVQPHPEILIRRLESPANLPSPCLELSSLVDDVVVRRQIGAPLLPSRLASVLLELALARLSAGDKPGSSRPRRQSARPGARDRRPG